ncbi:MAG: hypothetical protein WA825_14440 [Steroidobacteraceae bacterium]
MSFARAVWSAVTWRKLAVMLALSFSLPLSELIVGGPPIPLGKAIALGFSAIANLFVVLGADEVAKRGVPLRRVNTLAISSLLIGNCAIGLTMEWLFDDQFGASTLAAAKHWPVVLLIGINQSLWGVWVLFVYLNRRIAERMLQGVREAELRRVRLEAQLVESRLVAAQAQVDPQMLFGELAEIRDKLKSDAPDAGDHLDGLIQRLRVALVGTVLSNGPETDRA